MTSTGLAPATVHDAGLLLLRLTAGGFLLPHGLGKLFGWFGGPGLAGFSSEMRGFGLPAPAPLPLLLAAMQTLAGLCVVLGLFTPVAAASGAGFLVVTAVLNRSHGWFWMRGGMEYPLLWTATLLAIGLLGSGQWSLDAMRFATAGNAP